MFSPVKSNTNSSTSTSVYAVKTNIGLIIASEGFFIIGLFSIVSASAAGALFPGCPFRSALSDVMKFILKIFLKLSKRIPCGCLSTKTLRLLQIAILIFFWAASTAATAYAFLKYNKFYLFWFPGSVPLVYAAQQEVDHKPQKYKTPRLVTWVFSFVSLSSIISIYVNYPTDIVLYIITALAAFFASGMISNVSKSMAYTGEIDAISWLLITAPPQYPATLFKKAGQMTGSDSIGYHYRPRLLESLMPLLTHLITSYHRRDDLDHHSSDGHSPSSKPRQNFKIEVKRGQSDDVLNGRYGLPASLSLVDDDGMVSINDDPHLKNLEIYTACLAQLSDFEDYEGNFWCLREDAMQHPKLEQPLIDKLVVFANPRHHFQDGLRSAATKILDNYELDVEGNPVRSPANTIVPVRNVLCRGATMIMSVVVPVRASTSVKTMTTDIEGHQDSNTLLNFS